jgi:hypothetical protein
MTAILLSAVAKWAALFSLNKAADVAPSMCVPRGASGYHRGATADQQSLSHVMLRTDASMEECSAQHIGDTSTQDLAVI